MLLFVIHLDDYIILAPWFCAIQIFQALHPLSRQIKWTLCNILEVVALFWIQTRPIYYLMFPLIYLSDFTAWSLITWLANPKKTLLRKQLLATLKLSNGHTPAVLLPVQHQHNLQSSFLKQRFDLLLAENTYSINIKREWNKMSSVTWKIPFHSTCEKEMVSKGNVDSANLRICTLLNFNFSHK